MINIETLRRYFAADAVYVTQHTAKRFRERGIRMKDIKTAIAGGRIIEQYVVVSDEGSASSIITCYFPDPNLWDNNFTIRKKEG